MNKLYINIKALLVPMLLISSTVIANYTHPSVKHLIQSDSTPVGVVFEIIESNKHTWEWAAPLIQDLRMELKEKYPKIEIAVVSHGQEQFQLIKKKAKNKKQSILILENLVRKDNVSLHVCGTYSSWYGVDPDSYLDIVDVAISGPAKINDYINLGYHLIQLDKPTLVK